MEFAFHMSYAYPSVHWYGDSLSLRTLKPFFKGGKWCHVNETLMSHDCLCGDDMSKDLFPKRYRVRGHGVDSTKDNGFPLDLRVINDKDPLDNPSYAPDYVPPGYSHRRDYFDLYLRTTKDMYWADDIKYPAVGLVIFQMSMQGTYSQFVSELPRLLKELRKVYPTSRFIYRSATEYSASEFHAIDYYARHMFQTILGAQIWDVFTPAASQPRENRHHIPECAKAYSRSELIHIENQLLMNILVNNI
ncbi:hypothetical protein H4S04_000214 [Coemansia sp. S16]|nr:hypothetical protein H4S03_000266 [Coemansia sp. S3946]KAJ2054123.1 hypothetical protein H4S04_000214 [Coemansia sp. S16]